MKAEVRTASLREVRKQSFVPGVIYGKSIAPEAIQVEKKELIEAFNAFGTSITFPLTLGRKKHTVYFKNVQRNPMVENDFLNFELHCITKDETIIAHVPIILHGKELLEKNNLFAQQILFSVECEYTPDQAIAQFEFDVKSMAENDTVHVKDIPLSKKVTILDHPDHIVFLIKESKRTEVLTKPSEEEPKEQGAIESEPKE